MTAEGSVNGAESLVRTLVASGVDTCFANPGTSEMHFVAALDRVPGIRCVLALFEGVATGAADGYARLAGRPAVTLLHCGPGLANGLANLHNAQRARVPIVNIVGDQATYHRGFDAPLTADTEGWARAVSIWTRTARSAEAVGADAAAAVQAARNACGIATLILPSDTSWNEGGVSGRTSARRPAISGDAGDDRRSRACLAQRRAGCLNDDRRCARDGFARRRSSYCSDDQRQAHRADLQPPDPARARALPDRAPALSRGRRRGGARVASAISSSLALESRSGSSPIPVSQA